jgi:hypothetical protein
MKGILIAFAALTLSACASSKPVPPPPPPANTYFEVGKTTYSQAVQVLGEPNDSTRHADGSRTVHYFRSQSLVKTECATPYGKFRGGSEVMSDMLIMTFDKAGRLTQYSAISGKTLTGAGVPGVPAQASR